MGYTSSQGCVLDEHYPSGGITPISFAREVAGAVALAAMSTDLEVNKVRISKARRATPDFPYEQTGGKEDGLMQSAGSGHQEHTRSTFWKFSINIGGARHRGTQSGDQ
nr:hypothetical protein CFP56_72140 [Quercus suber]